jgi:hypothetical protein
MLLSIKFIITSKKCCRPILINQEWIEDIWESSPIDIDRALDTYDPSTPSSGTLQSKRLRLAHIYFKDGMLDQEGQKYLRIPSFKRILLETDDLEETKIRLEAQLAIGEIFPEGNLFSLIEDFTNDVSVYVLDNYDHSDGEDVMINMTIEEALYYHHKINVDDYSNIPGLVVGVDSSFKRLCRMTKTVPVKGIKFLSKDMKLSPDIDHSKSDWGITSFRPSKAGEKGLSIGLYYKEGLINASKH